jgi:phosphoesterase RecJ-like protein
MRQKSLNQIKKTLKSVKTAIVICHVDPDGDTIGSALALANILNQLKIKTTTYSVDGIPKVYRFLPGADQVKTNLPTGARYDCALTIDASDASRIGTKIKLRELASVVINIDHHPDNSFYGDVNYVEQNSSVAEQIYHLACCLGVKITKPMADCLYTAVITDTGNFRYENTSAETFLIAAELLKAGVNTHQLSTQVYDSKSLASIKICALALSYLRYSESQKVAWAAITETMMAEAGAKTEDLIGLVDRIRSIEGIEVAILFREDRGKIKINFRSKNRVNVSEIARHFGGGGHTKAAGAVIEGRLEEVESRVVAEVEKYLQASKFLVRE